MMTWIRKFFKYGSTSPETLPQTVQAPAPVVQAEPVPVAEAAPVAEALPAKKARKAPAKKADRKSTRLNSSHT